MSKRSPARSDDDRALRASGGLPSATTANDLRSTNDYWMACGRPFGVPDFIVGDDETMYSESIAGLFTQGR